MVVLDFEGKENITQGDSNDYGVGASSQSLRWSGLISSERNGLDYNYGVVGQGILNPSNLYDKTTIPIFDATVNKYINFCNGTNDLPLDPTTYSTAIFKAKLLEIVDYAVSTKGWSYSTIILPTINVRLDVDYGQRLVDFNEAIRQVALLRGCIYIDIYTQFNALSNKSSLFISDNLHINDAGHRQVANFYEAADYSPYTQDIPPTSKPLIFYGYKGIIN